MIDVTKASRETLENLAGNALAWDGCLDEKSCGLHSLRQQELLTKLRAECAPKLRSREQVDAELNQVCTAIAQALFSPSCRSLKWSNEVYNFGAVVADLDALMTLKDRWVELAKEQCAEPTAEEPDELDLSEHEVCSCEEAEGLKARVALLEQQNSGLLEQLKLVDNHSAEHFKARAEKAEARVAELEKAIADRVRNDRESRRRLCIYVDKMAEDLHSEVEKL